MSEIPEDNLPIVIETSKTPDAAVIWLHGLGADGNDFVPVVPALNLSKESGIRFIFPNAPHSPVSVNDGYVMRSWYDIYSLDNFDNEDKEGLLTSQRTVEELIQNENKRGIKSDRIILMGFSQGGAVALHTGIRYPQSLAGIGALSTYLPLQEEMANAKYEANANSSIFMAHGLYDPVVRYEYGDKSHQLLQQLGYSVIWNSYPIEHNVSPEEIQDIARWISSCLPPVS